MASCSFDIMDTAENNGPLVEVTLQSLAGLRYNNDGGAPNVTAAVGFAGSASDMQVSSSFLCGKTGNIVVESQKAVESNNNNELTCEWRSNERLMSRSFSSAATTSSQVAAQPHLTIRLPQRDQNIPTIPLSKMNRDCNVVDHTETENENTENNATKTTDDAPPSLDESETSSQSARRKRLQQQQQQQQQLELATSASEMRGASVIWSSSGAAMPDIIELHVTINIEYPQQHCNTDDEYQQVLQDQQTITHPVGIAYLVFFGSDTGTTVLDLPIKQADGTSSKEQQGDITNPLKMSGVTLDESASLRVKVSVGERQQQDTNSLQIKESFFQDMQKLEPILQQLHMASGNDNEQQASNNNSKDDDDDKDDKASTGSRFLCGSGDVSFMDLLRSLSGIVKNCDDGDGMLHQTDSMGSTIVTSASLGI